MNREEAIKVLNMVEAHRLADEAKRMAIKALVQEPCIQEKQANADKIDAVYIDGFKAGYSQARFDLEQEPCEDCISRQAVIDILDDAVKDYINENDFDKVQGIAWVKVQRLPSVTTQQKVGRWKDYSSGWMCSNCGAIKLNNTNYCPNCGAKMEVEE